MKGSVEEWWGEGSNRGSGVRRDEVDWCGGPSGQGGVS